MRSAAIIAAVTGLLALGLINASILQKETDAYFLHASSRNSARPGAGATLGGACCTVVWAPSPLPVNTWSYVALTYDGAQLTNYVNGSAAASVPASGAIQASTTRCGVW